MGVVRSIEEDQSEARRIKAADLQDAALALFAPENMRLVAVGPWKRGMKKALRELVAAYQERWNMR